MTRALFLDDNEERQYAFRRSPGSKKHSCIVSVYSADECIEVLSSEKFDFIYLDHDLGDSEKDGRFVARWMSDNKARVQPQSAYSAKVSIIIHSANIPAAEEMKKILDGAAFNTKIESFPQLLEYLQR